MLAIRGRIARSPSGADSPSSIRLFFSPVESPMPVYLPHRGRLLEFREDTDPANLPPWPSEGPGYLGLAADWHVPAQIVPLEFDITPFTGHPAVLAIRDIWYLTSQDCLGAAYNPHVELTGEV